MNKYLIYCESLSYAGYGQHFVANAFSKKEAQILVEDAANEYFYEQDNDQLEEDGLTDAGTYYTIVSTELFDETHECWKFYTDPIQAEFYTEVN